MEETTTLVLAGQECTVEAPALGAVKKIIASINRSAAREGDVDVLLHEATISVGLLIGKTEAEMDAMKISYPELVAAFNQVPKICGLAKKADSSGEAQAGI